MNKKQLYENIISSIAKEVKKALNEGEYNTTEQEEGKYLRCYVYPIVWDDATFITPHKVENDDSNATLAKKYLKGIFSKNYPMCGRDWCVILTIDIDNGNIVNWPQGISVEFDYKSNDINYFEYLTKDEKIIYSTLEGDCEYLFGPDWMQEWGDYLRLHILPDGSIVDYNKEELMQSIQEWIDENNN